MRKDTKSRFLIGLGIITIISGLITGIYFYITRGDTLNEEKVGKELEGTISFVSNRTDKKEELELLINEFEALYPKVKINLELIGDAEEILQRKATVQELPDITLVPGAIKVSEYNKYFLPLDELGFTEDNIYNYSTGLGTDGKLYNLTTSITWNGIIYNKNIFKKLNIKDIPTTNEEFFEICYKIKELGIVPMALNYKQAWTMNSWIYTVPSLLDDEIEKDVMIEDKDILDTDGALFKSLEFARNIVQNGYSEEDLLNYQWQQCKADLRDGNVAMFFWNSDFKYQLSDIGMDIDNIGMFPFPESKKITIFGDYKMGIAKNTKYPEVAKAFLKFLFEDDRYANTVNIVSPLKNSNKSKEIIKELELFNIPIEIHSDNINIEDIEGNNIYEKYESIRKLIGLDYSFVQEYTISDNPNKLKEDINKRWNELED